MYKGGVGENLRTRHSGHRTANSFIELSDARKRTRTKMPRVLEISQPQLNTYDNFQRLRACPGRRQETGKMDR